MAKTTLRKCGKLGDSMIPFQGLYPREALHMCWETRIETSSYLAYNSNQTQGTTHVSFNRGMNNKTVAYLCDGVLQRYENE